MNEGAVDDRVKKYIRENCASEFRQYLDTPVGDLPDEFRKHLDQIDGNLYKSCVEHGVRLVDYFRIYLMKTFDINRGKGPVEYLRGIARIACEDLDFFGYNANQSDIALFKQLVLFVYNNPDDISIKYDSNLNGLSFDEFKKQVNDIRKAFNIRMRSKTGNVKGDRKYKVVAINSGSEAEKYGRYTTWCITHGSYSSYAKNGSRFYFCLEDGFENVKKEVGPGCPLDRYGLSMVSVLIDIDGEPTIITTRWNHEHDGENNENFHTVEQFEKVMGRYQRGRDRAPVQRDLQRDGLRVCEQHQHRGRRHPFRRLQSGADAYHQRLRSQVQHLEGEREAVGRGRPRGTHRGHQRKTDQSAVRGSDQDQARQQRDAYHRFPRFDGMSRYLYGGAPEGEQRPRPSFHQRAKGKGSGAQSAR